MLEEHGLTLPPARSPLRGFYRNGQVNWRRTALYDARVAIRRPGEFATDLEGRMSDPAKRMQLLDLIRSVRAARRDGPGPLSHRRPALRLADHILVLADGKVERAVQLEKLLETSDEMRRLWAG